MPIKDKSAVALSALKKLRRDMLQSPWSLPGAFDQAAPLSDPYSSMANSLLSLNNSARLVFGRITDSTQIAHVYRVHCSNLKQPVVAVDGQLGSTLFGGAHQLNTYPVGQDVLMAWEERYPWGIILCALPLPGNNPQLHHPGIIATTSRQRVDEAHKRPMRMADNGRIPSATGGRPIDSTGVGEWGAITETGMKFFLDPFMALMGLDEMCQIATFYHDQYTRIAGYNLAIWSACREMESLDDEGELRDVTGYSMYPWELLGQMTPQSAGRVLPPEEWQVESPHLSKIEPNDQLAIPFQREREWHAYLGQGGKTLVQAPPLSGAASVYGSTEKYPGLIDISRTADGQLHLSAARRISIMKRPVIISPARKARPEQPGDRGDNNNNYKASGHYGEGPEHKIAGGPEITANEHQTLQRIAGLPDTHAYASNFATIHPFIYHERDYSVPEESATDWTDGVSQVVPNFAELSDSHGLDPEEHKHEIQIDQRYGKQAIYALLSAFDMLDDGSIVLTAGSGAAITLGADGNVYIDAPGDIIRRAGRNTIDWAGNDHITRAQNAFDITASKGQGRIKTEKDLFVLAANSGDGGLFLESRSAGDSYAFDELGEKAKSSGIVLRAKNSSVGTQAQNVYVRTVNGNITLDAHRGNGALIMQAQGIEAFLGSSMALHFGLEGDVQKSSYFSAENTVLASSLCVNGTLGVTEHSYMGGSISIAKGHIYTETAQRDTEVYPLQEKALSDTLRAVDQCSEQAEDTIPKAANNSWDTIFEQQWYQTNKLGNTELIDKAEVSLRTQDDYRTSDFIMYESQWQQLARLAGQSLPIWEEPAVTSRGQQTYPYPGKEKFEGDAFMQQDLAIFDAQAQRAKDRGTPDSLTEEYAEPKLPEPTPSSLQQYPVIRSVK